MAVGARRAFMCYFIIRARGQSKLGDNMQYEEIAADFLRTRATLSSLNAPRLTGRSARSFLQLAIRASKTVCLYMFHIEIG